MASGYASRLSDYRCKGECGLPESRDSSRSVTLKIKRLVELVKDASQVVIITGAGISTAAGIRDFRGPNGVWTKEKEARSQSNGASKKRKRQWISREPAQQPPVVDSFLQARPTLTHRAITKLVLEGVVCFCVSQNVDGLHMASGIPRGKYAAVHGCSRTERCENEKCKAEFFRDFEIDGLSFQKTGRMCSLCNCALTDTLLDWEDALPAEDLARAEDEIEKPGTVLICLGTSLRIKPVGDLPELAEKYVIVNLQVTPHDEKAALVIRAPVDDVMSELMQQLGYHSWQDEEPPGIERVWQPPHLKKNNNNKST